MQPHSLIVGIGRTRWTLSIMAEMGRDENRKMPVEMNLLWRDRNIQWIQWFIE
jgi:hypothetical protein